MKKIVYILVLLLLCSCTKQEGVKIVSPSGAPALAFYNELDNLEVNEAGVIKTLILSDNKPDYVVLPTNVAVSLINKGASYKLGATITFGNFYIVDTGIDEDESMDESDKIVLFQQGGIPDQVFNSIYSFENVEYVNDASDALRQIVSKDGTAEYVLLAEPMYQVAKEKNENISIYANLQDEYMKLFNHEIYQASILVNNELNKTEVNEFLKKIENDINELINNPTLLLEKTDNYEEEKISSLFGNINASIKALESNNSLNLGFKLAYDNKEGIDIFLENLKMSKTSEDIYFH